MRKRLLIARPQPVLGSRNVAFDNAFVIELDASREKQFTMILNTVYYDVLVSGEFETVYTGITTVSVIDLLTEISGKEKQTHNNPEVIKMIDTYLLQIKDEVNENGLTSKA